METPPLEVPPLDLLLANLMAGRLNSAGWEQLQQILLGDRAARAKYVDLIVLDSLLYWQGRGANDLAALGLRDAISLDSEFGAASSTMHDAAFLPAIKDDQFDESLDAQAASRFVGGSGAKASAKHFSPAPRFGRAALFWMSAAAALILVSAALIVVHSFGRHAAEPIAMGASLDAVWGGQTTIARGESFATGIPQSLTAGYVQLKSANGLAVVIQGPANFTVQKPGVLLLNSGRLTATVPKVARGFTVNTPVTSIVDLGTEFGVVVSPDGQTEVQTFRGTVSISSIATAVASPTTFITAGHARRVSSPGEVTEIPVNTNSFVQTKQFDDWNAAPAENPYQRWKAFSERLLHDPDLVAYYTFDNTSPSGDRLRNLTAAGTSLDGILRSDQTTDPPSWTTGRWPGKGALEFDRDQHEYVEIPSAIGGPLDFSRGDQSALPFAICIWVRGDATQPSDSSIVAKGVGYFEQFVLENAPGDEHLSGWVRDSSSGNRDVDPQNADSTSQLDGSWQQLVFNYDPDRGELKLYRNGTLIASRSDIPRRLLQTAEPLVLGGREGNRHDVNDDGTPSRFTSLTGRVDELAIFRRSLAPEQIREMYLAEKPD